MVCRHVTMSNTQRDDSPSANTTVVVVPKLLGRGPQAIGGPDILIENLTYAALTMVGHLDVV